MCLLTQGVALVYVVLPLRGVPLTTFDTPSFLHFELLPVIIHKSVDNLLITY